MSPIVFITIHRSKDPFDISQATGLGSNQEYNYHNELRIITWTWVCLMLVLTLICQSSRVMGSSGSWAKSVTVQGPVHG
uniref:Uncharacterized protein n=1 Tax=Nelumbo nucifera TaxID=4432 RepID=A0A822ZY01_NELNU|nr:TPA_asm: hypothetical protein HUJ06_017986 [Nelumbo nucifera]